MFYASNLWSCGAVAEHSGHHLELMQQGDEVNLICHQCERVIVELTSVGARDAIDALEFPPNHLQPRYRAHYVHCKAMWVHETYMVTPSQCPNCRSRTLPFMVRDLETAELKVLVEANFAPQGGWPKGINGIFHLCWAESPAFQC